MDSRFVALVLTAALVVALLAPAGVTVTDVSAEDSSVATGDGVDAVAFDRLRPTVVATGPPRDGERVREHASERANEHANERAGGYKSERASRPADPDDALEQPTRAAVYSAVESSPGETLSDVADTVDVTKSTVRYHVDVLRDAGLVGVTEVAGALRVAPADDDVELAAVREANGAGAVLAALTESEPASVTALAAAADRAPSTVSHHLSALEDRGIVERERVGEAVMTTLTPETRSAMALEPPAPADD